MPIFDTTPLYSRRRGSDDFLDFLCPGCGEKCFAVVNILHTPECLVGILEDTKIRFTLSYPDWDENDRRTTRTKSEVFDSLEKGKEWVMSEMSVTVGTELEEIEYVLPTVNANVRAVRKEIQDEIVRAHKEKARLLREDLQKGKEQEIRKARVSAHRKAVRQLNL